MDSDVLLPPVGQPHKNFQGQPRSKILSGSSSIMLIYKKYFKMKWVV